MSELKIMDIYNRTSDKVLDKFGFGIYMIPDGEHYFRTIVSVEPTNDFFGWLFSLDSSAEILDP